MATDPAVSSTDLATQIHAASVKLPPFSPNETLTWFRRAETQFRLKGVTKSSTKSDHVIAVLPEDVFRRIASWLDDQPDDIDYDQLKTQLLDEFSPSPSERARRVLNLPNTPLGDRTPKEVWHEITTLCRLPKKDASGNYQQVDLKKEVWLRTLPSHVREQLHNTDDTDVNYLVDTADKIMEAHRQAQRQTTIASATDAEDQPGEANAATATKTPTRRPQRPFFNATIDENGICSYHARFGANARRCIRGCQWKTPKNAQGGRS